ncbi:MAG: iron uptake porin [Cyanobacteria bacterium P01_A01_bin.68]
MLTAFGRFFVFVSQIAAITFCLSHRVEANTPKNNIDSFHPQVFRADVTQKFTDVSELSDIQSDEWYFKVLQYFIQRYKIDTGYSLDFFQRQGTIKRQEFAFIVNQVIQHLNKLQNQQPNFATEEELKALRRLQSEFSSELDIVKHKVAELEKNSFPAFSTTTTLSGESIFALTAVGKGKKVDEDEKTDSNLTFSSRIKLQLNTTFTGKDRLKTSLKTSNIKSLNSATGTDMARLAYQGDDNNKLELGDLTYRFPIGKKTRIYIGAKGLDITDFGDSINPYLDATDDGSVSRFAQRNPIFSQGGGAGIGVKYQISDDLEFGMGYVADDADEPEVGLSKSDYAGIAQLTLEPSKKLSVGLNYIHSYNNIDTNTGSDGANDPFDDNSESITGNSFGLQASVGINQNLFLGSWIGYTRAKANDLPDKPTASILNWAVTFAFPNLGNEGNLGGIIIGQPPKLIQNQYQSDNEEYIDKDTSLHLEAFYRFNINDNIAITPGVIMITNPEHNNDKDTIYIGTLRTTFSF